MRLPDDELGAWLRLVHRTGVGRGAMRELLAAFGSAEAVAAAPKAEIEARVGPVRAAELAHEPPGHAARVEATRRWLDADAARRRVMTLGDPDYPPLLLQTADPPLLMYLEGRAELLRASSVALVGSRRPTPQGLDHARQLARELSERGWTVVSGLAAGIDGAAHAGALQAGPGGTIAVVGTGVDLVYPPSHGPLRRRIADEGLVVSEYPLGTSPLQHHFPQRNRIIAGLSRGTLVVEAALRSGSLITARLANEAGREVFAVPGSIQSPQARGCHALLREGARLVESIDDLVDELGLPEGAPPLHLRPAVEAGQSSRPATPDDDVLRALGHDPVTLDALMARSGRSAASLNVRLLELELEGRVARLPGGLFQRRAAG